MSELKDFGKLVDLAEVLISGTTEMPATGQIAEFESLLRRAVKASGYSDVELRAALDAIPDRSDWSSCKSFAKSEPGKFKIASTLVSAAYYMSREVLDRLKFPIGRKYPAADDEFLNEYETGILDPVIARGPRYRDPGNG